MNPIDVSSLPLRDIHLPSAVAWWPPATGWWIVLGIVVAALVATFILYRRRYRERAAIRGLKAVAQSLAGGAAPVVCVQRISMILRRFAMSVSPGKAVAGLTGEEWLGFLDGRWGRDEFSAGIGRVLIYGPYAPPDRVSADDVNALNTLCLDWIRAQRPPEN
ncbi:MAG: DUF4381 domain-containing protein [Gammaproteobacteria bacterium]|jgi:hypothetical protein